MLQGSKPLDLCNGGMIWVTKNVFECLNKLLNGSSLTLFSNGMCTLKLSVIVIAGVK